MSVFAYIVNGDGSRGSGEMVCPDCGKNKPQAVECHRKDYSYGYEVIGCYWCNQTLDAPF